MLLVSTATFCVILATSSEDSFWAAGHLWKALLQGHEVAVMVVLWRRFFISKPEADNEISENNLQRPIAAACRTGQTYTFH